MTIGRPRKYKERQAAKKDLEEGILNPEEIAEKYGISRSMVYSVAREIGVTHNMMTFPSRRAILWDLAETRLTVKEIARKHDMSLATIYNVAKENQVDLQARRAIMIRQGKEEE